MSTKEAEGRATAVFDVYGVSLEISGPSELVNRIREDIQYFELENPVRECILRFEVLEPGEASFPVLFPAFHTRMCRVSGWGRERVCDYGEGTWVYSRYEKGRRIFRVVAGQTDLAYEALYSALLSSLGEELDLRGYHRVHALGIEKQGRRAIVLLPMGGGKSAIALLLQREPDVRIYSDESPLIRGGRVFPFPLRGALRPEVARALGIPEAGRLFRRKLFAAKELIPFDLQKIASPAEPDCVLVGVLNRSGIGVRTSVFARLAALFVLSDACVLGRGLAQMLEFMLRGDSLWRIPWILCRRFLSVFWLIFSTQAGWMEVGVDAKQNAHRLAIFLAESSF